MLLNFVSLILLVSHAAAQISLDTFPNVVSIDQQYTLNWTATEQYTYTIWLVVDADPDENDSAYGWKRFAGLGAGLTFDSLNPSYTWTVPSNVTVNGTYALWLNGFHIPFDGAGVAVVTDWFTVSARTATSSTSSTASATSTSNSGDESGKNHHSGISGGAIAGIVIGCLVAVALIFGAVLLFRKRRNRSTPESRDAEARANRLAPVMEENFPGYELSTRRSRPA